MEKRLFIAEAVDLVAIIEESNNVDINELPIDSEEIANYWVNDILRASGKLPVPRIKRFLDETETYLTLSAEDSSRFMDLLFHTIAKFDISAIGAPTLQHRVENGSIEFYILRG